MIHSLTLDSFYLTQEQLENSPSRQDGIDKDTEANLRMYGCQVIQEAGILLGFDQVVMATGQVLLHRFYCKRSMKTFNVKKMAATALWVAAKLEEVKEVREHPRKLIEMVMVAVDRCITRREAPEGRKLAVLDSHSKEGEEFRRALIRYESEMLKAFGFIMNVEHPHRLLCNYCQIIFTPYMGKPDRHEFVQDFIQQAWNIANDSLRTNLCVRFKGSVVACGIIFYAARKLQVPLPDDWWELFLVKLEDMCEVCRILHELYLAPKPQFIPVCHQLLPSKPPTPAVGGAGVKGAAVTATPTPMLGASPALGTRPGDKPLDPSIRRTIPASESTPNLAAAGAAAGAAANGAAGSTLASPEGTAAAAAPGSARKRSRSRSPHDDSRKRQQLESGPPSQGASQPQSQPDQQRPQASGAAGGADVKQPLQRPRSAAGDRDRERERERDRDRDSKRSDRDGGRSSHRDRPRSHSRDKRRRSSSRDRSRRSRSRDRRGGHRDKSRRSRSRDRKRSRSRDRRRSRSRSPDRRRDGRDSRGRSTHDRRDRTDGSRDERSRQRESPAKPKPREQQQQRNEANKFPLPPADKFPSPPPDPASKDAAAQLTEQDAAGKAAAAGDSSKANGVGSSRSKQGHEEGTQPSQAAGDIAAGLPPVQPKPKPKAVRKLQPAGGVTSPVTSPGGSQEGKLPAGAAGTAD